MTPDTVLRQLNEVEASYQSMVKKAKYEDLSDLPDHEISRFVTVAYATVERVAGRGSVYLRQVDHAMQKYGPSSIYSVPVLAGVADALANDFQSGYLRSLQEIIHADLFADFLEMSDHLLSEGYKDAAAVIAGSSLEAHLRQLCEKMGIDTTYNSGGDTMSKKADRLNAELAKAAAYEKLDQKSVTAWLDLRNKAAHGNYDEYGAAQVALQIAGIRDFIVRNPA